MANAQLDPSIQALISRPGVSAPVTPAPPAITLSDEQQKMVDVAMTGRDVIVEACCGSGKTTTIQQLCQQIGRNQNVLYLTYSKLLKLDAQRRVQFARVQNYHGVVYPSLLSQNIRCGISESIKVFNDSFKHLSANFPTYDVLIIDEYQDINEEYARLLMNIKSKNPLMQIIMVGDMAQKISANTRIDVQGFVKGFVNDPEMAPFTQSFRLGEDLGERLSSAWNKPIHGMNAQQIVRFLDFDEAVDIMREREPGQLLSLGKRNGDMTHALNNLEATRPTIFNKNSVYASIRDGDRGVTYSDDTAVFTTFDSSKGMERHTSMIFDYDERNWDVRLGFPNVDPEVLRNVFLVAASRGKQEVVFVRPRTGSRRHAVPSAQLSIGAIPVTRFQNLPAVSRPTYPLPFWASEAFDFKYAENVQDCFALLDVEREDDGKSSEIEVNRADGLIDLSPVVGTYQEAIFFDDYDAELALLNHPDAEVQSLIGELRDGDHWHNALVLAAASTRQMRYIDQVTATIPEVTKQAIARRLGALLSPSATNQVPLKLRGQAMFSAGNGTPFVLTGIADTVVGSRAYELKFTSELSHPMFLQLALYIVMGGYEDGVLWNIRTGERWRVEVPDPQRFLDAVVLCVTKQSYRAFRAA